MPRVAKPRLLWRPFYEHCAKCLEKYCKHETRRRCFFKTMHQISDKCCNIQSVAKVYELKSQPSYKEVCLCFRDFNYCIAYLDFQCPCSTQMYRLVCNLALRFRELFFSIRSRSTILTPSYRTVKMVAVATYLSSDTKLINF